ncbi:MAG: ATP-binding protein [Acidobacteria bacterium]|nr:ATP-binding protein [Acidobacteriota bacterium]
MRTEFRPRFSTVLVGMLTIALGVLAWVNFQQQRKYRAPYDGVTWEDGSGRVFARQVEPGGPAERAGIRAGDWLMAINGVPIVQTTRVARMLYRVGAWGEAEYVLVRQGQALKARVIAEPGPSRSPLDGYLQFVAVLYLAIGLFVVLRRAQAPRVLHFYLFCLASFVLYFYRYTGKLNNFDWTIYWANVAATLLQPALFLHFALAFPEPKPWVRKRGWLVRMVYAPAALLLVVQAAAVTEVLEVRAPMALVSWWLDRIAYAHLAALFLAGIAVLYYNYRRAETPLARLQMKWLTRGVALGIVPFAAFYALPFLFGALPSGWMELSVLSLLFIPLTFGYAIARYRLMDVDILFRRGAAYTLATMLLIGLYFTAIALIGNFFSANLPATGTTGLVVAMVVSAILFQPLRLRIQERLDRYFYRDRYDYRRTLTEFGRELSARTDLEPLLGAVVERLSRTLTVDKVAVFLLDEQGRVTLERSLGLSFAGQLDLRFLDPGRGELARGCLFFENTRLVPGEAEPARASIAALDLHYYVACRAQGRIVAFLGLGKTAENDLLSSEDVALVETLSGYLGAAVENAQLYASLKRKAAEYARLKDFSENIIESINMGILVLDLNDRIESWNTQLELMYGLSRDQAYGRPIDEVFPAEVVAELVRFRGDEGIHNLYKHHVRTPSGEERVLNIAIAPLVSKSFELIGRLVIFDDVTEQVELERQLVQAEKLSSIGMLAAGVAHEVNTPLSVISSYAQMLARQLPAEQHGKLLDKIIKSTFRASEIVSNLLNFSRTGNAEMGAQDLNAVIRDTVALLEHTLKTSGVRVDARLCGEAPLVQGNTGKLQQVFLNLFLNARDAMPEGGRLRVTTETSEAAVRVEVSDTGLGIPRENIQRIYDPFFTTKSARPGNGGEPRSGTGLGLSVTYGIIKEHAGKIRVESVPGHGTSFLLEFPRLRKAVSV